MTEFHCEHALIETGWASGVTIFCGPEGRITQIVTDRTPSAKAIRLGIVVPGMSNLHSHAFQRGMAGLTERRGAGEDSFWSWRNLMYRFLDQLQPDDVEAIAALAYCEMLEAGFTRVAEFHYLHHGIDGSPYDDPAEMAAHICAAAEQTGIGLTLLPVFYRWAGFNKAEPGPGQQRFINDLDTYEDLWISAARHVGDLQRGNIGCAPHSLRAAAIDEISTLRDLHKEAPFHIHIAEQEKEVADCIAANGARPVELLMRELEVDERWCLVHATHLNPQEIGALASSGAIAGLCPLTEANLGDGIFPARDYLAAGGRFGIGSDSHIRIDLAEELRLLEYGQRLILRQRNILTGTGKSTGRQIFEAALNGGAQACGSSTHAIAIGHHADLVELDNQAPIFAARSGDAILDSWIFSGDGRAVRSNYVSGKAVVRDGACLIRQEVETRYRHAIERVTGQVGRYDYDR